MKKNIERTYEIYVITNKINNKSYVGQSVDAKNRWKHHVWDALRANPSKRHAIQNAIAKYGVDNFTFQVIEIVNSSNESNDAEEFYIQYLMTLAPNGYNLTTGGDSACHSEETKKKISDKLKIVGSFVGKKGKDHPNFGTKFSKERKLSLSKRLSGENGGQNKLTTKQVLDIYDLGLKGFSIGEIINKLKLTITSKVTISNIFIRKTWVDTTKDLPKMTKRPASRRRDPNEKIMIDIKTDHITNNISIEDLAIKYKLSYSDIYFVLNPKP